MGSWQLTEKQKAKDKKNSRETTENPSEITSDFTGQVQKNEKYNLRIEELRDSGIIIKSNICFHPISKITVEQTANLCKFTCNIIRIKRRIYERKF